MVLSRIKQEEKTAELLKATELLKAAAEETKTKAKTLSNLKIQIKKENAMKLKALIDEHNKQQAELRANYTLEQENLKDILEKANDDFRINDRNSDKAYTLKVAELRSNLANQKEVLAAELEQQIEDAETSS